MWVQYFSSLFHFALSVGMAATLAAMAWLYADGFKASRAAKELVRVVGLIILAFGFLLTGVEAQGLGWSLSFLATEWVPILAFGWRAVGYGVILISLMMEQLQPMPSVAAIWGSLGKDKEWLTNIKFGLPVLPGLVGLMYWRRSTVGLEAHVRRPAWGFFGLSIFELTQLSRMWYESNQVEVWQLVAPFGVIWWMGRVAILLALLIMGSWVFGYLLKQFTSQLFLIFAGAFVVVFFLVTTGYTGMLLNELRNEAADEVKTSIRVLTYAFDEQELRLLSEARMMASELGLAEAIEQGGAAEIAPLVTKVMAGKRISQAVVIDRTGKVIWRSDYPDRMGEIWTDTLTVTKLARGEEARTVMGNSLGSLSTISLMGAAPVMMGNQSVGGIILGLAVDPLLLSGIKTATGLEAAVFYKKTLVATSLSASGKNIPVGIEEERLMITDPVLVRGETYQGPINFLETPYIGVYAPLTDAQGGVVGMVFGGREEVDVMAAAARSLELTFYATAILMAMCMYPAWVIAKKIAKQVR